MAQPITIGLLWHSMNSDNLGVGALTLSNIALLRNGLREADFSPQFIVIGWRDPRPWYADFDDVENAPIRTRDIARPGGKMAALFRKCDLIFDIGGGDSFTDIYGVKRFLTIWTTKVRARLNGCPLILSPQTIGPFQTVWAPPLARMIMNRTDFIVTRDAPSTRYIETLRVRAEHLEATDVAMGLPYDPPPPRDNGKNRIGLNVSGLLFNGGYTQSNQFGLKTNYPALVRRIVTWCLDQPDVELHLVGHVQSKSQPVEDDHRVGEALAKEFPGVVVSPFFQSPSEAKSYIAGCDFFIGARMHATIAAFSTGVPVVPMAYSRKFAGVFGTLGYNHIADCKTDDADAIMARIADGFANRDALRAEIGTAMEGVQERLGRYVARAVASAQALPSQ